MGKWAIGRGGRTDLLDVRSVHAEEDAEGYGDGVGIESQSVGARIEQNADRHLSSCPLLPLFARVCT
jgi:hypothetical protein